MVSGGQSNTTVEAAVVHPRNRLHKRHANALDVNEKYYQCPRSSTGATADTRTCEEFYDCVDSPLGPCCAPFTVGAADGRDTYGGEVGPSVFVVTPVFSEPYFVAEKPVPL